MESTYGATKREEEKTNIDFEEKIIEAVLNKKKGTNTYKCAS